MNLKVFVKLKNTLKTPSSGQKNPKNPKKTKKTKKKKHWAGYFFKKHGFFPTLPATQHTDKKEKKFSFVVGVDN